VGQESGDGSDGQTHGGDVGLGQQKACDEGDAELSVGSVLAWGEGPG
jgi:hypothetical protein